MSEGIADFQLPIADWSDGGRTALDWQLNAVNDQQSN